MQKVMANKKLWLTVNSERKGMYTIAHNVAAVLYRSIESVSADNDAL